MLGRESHDSLLQKIRLLPAVQSENDGDDFIDGDRVLANNHLESVHNETRSSGCLQTSTSNTSWLSLILQQLSALAFGMSGCSLASTRRDQITSRLAEMLGEDCARSWRSTAEPTLSVNFFSCSDCCTAFSTLSALKKHGSSAHRQPEGGSAEVSCWLCASTFSPPSLLRSHLVTDHRHSEDAVHCGECAATFLTWDDLQHHLSVDHMPCSTRPTAVSSAVFCAECGSRFSNKWNLKRHANSVHSSVPESDLSGRQISDLSDNLIPEAGLAHTPVGGKESSSPTSQFACAECRATFKKSSGLSRHSLTVHGRPERSSRLSCDECSTVFFLPARLRRHMFVCHAPPGAQRPRCSDCRKTFTRNDHLKRHRQVAHARRSVPSRPSSVACPECGSSFDRLSSLQRHVHVVHGFTWRPASLECGENVTSEGRLGERPVRFQGATRTMCDARQTRACVECGLVFRSRCDWSRHVVEAHQPRGESEGGVGSRRAGLDGRNSLFPPPVSCGRGGEHNDRTHQCVGCGAVFESTDDLETHFLVEHYAGWNHGRSLKEIDRASLISTLCQDSSNIRPRQSDGGYLQTALTGSVDNVCSFVRSEVDCGAGDISSELTYGDSLAGSAHKVLHMEENLTPVASDDGNTIRSDPNDVFQGKHSNPVVWGSEHAMKLVPNQRQTPPSSLLNSVSLLEIGAVLQVPDHSSQHTIAEDDNREQSVSPCSSSCHVHRPDSSLLMGQQTMFHESLATPTTPGTAFGRRPSVSDTLSVVRHDADSVRFGCQGPRKEYACPQCDSKLSNAYNLRRHIRRIHEMASRRGRKPKNGFACHECSAVFCRSDHMLRHVRVVHKKEKVRGYNDSVTCPECNVTMNRTSNLKRHIMSVHGATARRPHSQCPLVCRECGAQFRQAGYLKRHISIVHAGQAAEKSSIPGLAASCTTVAGLHDRNVAGHQRGPGAASSEVVFMSSPNLHLDDDRSGMNGQPTHLVSAATGSDSCGRRAAPCSLCPASFDTVLDLHQHIDTAHINPNRGGAAAWYAERNFGSPSRMFTAEKQPPATCYRLFQDFPAKGVHFCSVCKLSFHSEQSLTKHISLIHGDDGDSSIGSQPPVSSSPFSQTLTPHLDTNGFCPAIRLPVTPNAVRPNRDSSRRGDKCHTCPHCFSSFTRTQNLKRHIRSVHLGLKRRPLVQCPQCSVTLSTPASISRHLSSCHTNDALVPSWPRVAHVANQRVGGGVAGAFPSPLLSQSTSQQAVSVDVDSHDRLSLLHGRSTPAGVDDAAGVSPPYMKVINGVSVCRQRH